MRYLFLLLSLCSLSVQAVEVGQRLPDWSLEDQFEQPVRTDASLQVMLLANDKAASSLLEEAMAGRAKGWLEQRHVLFVADISRMPSLIASMFALPAMRDYSYRVALDLQSAFVPQLKPQDDSVLWLDLEQLTVTGQRRFEDAASLRQALERLQP